MWLLNIVDVIEVVAINEKCFFALLHITSGKDEQVGIDRHIGESMFRCLVGEMPPKVYGITDSALRINDVVLVASVIDVVSCIREGCLVLQDTTIETDNFILGEVSVEEQAKSGVGVLLWVDDRILLIVGWILLAVVLVVITTNRRLGDEEVVNKFVCLIVATRTAQVDVPSP